MSSKLSVDSMVFVASFMLQLSCSQRTTTCPPAPTEAQLFLREVTLIDVARGSLHPHTTVEVRGTRIHRISPTVKSCIPAGAQTVEGDGRFLIPALWDMHSHSVWSEEAMRTFLPLYVTQGIAGIRDMGGRLDLLSGYRAAFKQGSVAWPRIVAAGLVLDGPDPVQPDISIAAADPFQAARAVESLKAAGADFIKIYTLLGRDEYFAAFAQAKRLGLPVAGHVPMSISPQEAAMAGQVSIEHLRDEFEPLMCSLQVSGDCEALAQLFIERGTWQVPTLIVLQHKAAMDDEDLAIGPRLRFVPKKLREEWLAERTAKIKRGSEYLQRKREWYRQERHLAELFIREHVPILAGSDAGVAFSYPGFSLHDELALMVELGMTPLAALQSATVSPAYFLGERATMGAIEVGHVADMVVLRDNPLVNISATTSIESVVLRGRIYTRRQLDALLDNVARDALH